MIIFFLVLLLCSICVILWFVWQEKIQIMSSLKSEDGKIGQIDTRECRNIVEFKNRSWFVSLEALFKSVEFRDMIANPGGEESKHGSLSDYDYLGEGCLLNDENVFVFAHLYGLYS